MKLSDFDYKLPKKLIAQTPIKPRDHSRLILLNKKTGKVKHRHFYDIINYLHSGDVLVLNNTKVFPARLIGEKKLTGGKIEVFLLQKIKGNLWQCLLGGHGRRAGLEIKFKQGLEGQAVKDNQDGTWGVEFNMSGRKFMMLVEKIGQTPLPPYIKRQQNCPAASRLSRLFPGQDKRDYQTVYANEKKIGSVAAPTAGFHFTPKLIKRLKNKGVQFEFITLHVGLGTFAPVKADDITKHKMHAEWVEVNQPVINNIIKAKKEGRRIIAVGTTSLRTIEAVFNKKAKIKNKKFAGWVNIFIYPGYKFKMVEALITNFHLPRSTLLMLVSALAGKKNINKAYGSALKNKYRFYSYGDAMLIY